MTNFLAYSFMVVVLAALACSVFYTGSRVSMYFNLSRRGPVVGGISLILFAALVTMAVAVRSTSPVIGTLYVLSGYALYLYLNLFPLLLCVHAIERLWRGAPKWSGMVAIALSLAATVAGAIGADSFSVVQTDITVAALSKEITVMHISDLHLGHHRGREYLARVIEETNRRKPDLVLITGDLVDSTVALLPGVLDPFSTLVAPAYFVTGNHETDVGIEQALEHIASSGLHILHNQVIDVNGIQLIGLDYMNADKNVFNMHPSHETRTVKEVVAALPVKTDKPAVLMHHSPVGIQYAAAKGVDLVLAGHTHGGQVLPFNWITPLLFTFNHGLYHQGKTQIFVSQGAGTFMLRARLGTANEIDLLRLIPGG